MVLLPRIRCCLLDWNGQSCRSCPLLLSGTQKDDRTLAEIYSDIPSPIPTVAPGWQELSHRLLDFADDLSGLGMRSTLFKYQRRSVATLLHKEMDMSPIPDPLYIPRVDLRGDIFYLKPGQMEVLHKRPMVSPARGGILCEELGTGKTVMILTLIVVTIREISSPEESLHDDRLAMTPVAFRHFPSIFETARKRLRSGKRVNIPMQPGDFPSLVELLLHHNRASPYIAIPDSSHDGTNRYQRRQELEERFELTRLARINQANTPFYFHYENGEGDIRAARKAKSGPRLMYLTNATIVLVPANLLSQWDREIVKHCEYPLRVLVLRAGTTTPSAKSLASDYDIILMTYSKFTVEANRKSISELYPWQECKCHPFQGTRVPDCHCSNVPNVSPFFQVRWKRLVIDEGHVSSSLSTTLIQLVRVLSVERRWIVTGTPTTNLLGLSFGNKSANEEEDASDDRTTIYGQEASPSSSSRSGSIPLLMDHDSVVLRMWNKYDRQDLSKLANMITHFISVPQFSTDVKSIYNEVIGPLFDPNGPRPGAIQVLTQVMQMVMVRHRIDDIENDVVLPPVTHTSVLLDLEPYAIKSYNAMQASIVINAIDSQRTDQDYLFHPSNTEHLQVAVKNMSQLMLWSVDDLELYYVDQLLAEEENHMRRAIERKVSQDDMRLLLASFRHIRRAATDELWRSLQSHEDLPYHVSCMNPKVFEAWTRSPEKDPDTPMMNGLMHVDRVIKLQDYVTCRPLARIDTVVEEGQRIAEEDHELRRLFMESQKKKISKRTNKRPAQIQDEHPSELADSSAKKARATDTLKEMQKELDVSLARLEQESELSNRSTPGPTSHQPASISCLSSSPFANVRIGHSASSKINWIINEVKSCSATEKFLIFSGSELSLAHVAEALELIQVKFLRFTSQVEPRYREQLVLTFETSETYRVFLMELKHGARGLNLISASRIIFCEPVWQADVESQAIKRAHRIGQAKKITVTTLAIRGTAEEKMVARRELLKGSRDKTPKLIEESGMRHFIANPQFIEAQPELLTSVNEPLVKMMQAEINGTTDSLPKPTKRIRFTSPHLGQQ
ncbi:hypothetical protein APHAL10511_000899 [Amanita phalloides]|nr:hypothetical protein APHAL10511_000899 [Amanita phalloides]